MMAPELCFFATFSVDIAAPDTHIDIGDTLDGHRKIVPITGGTVTGPDCNGHILAGGGDFQIMQAPDLVRVHARYVIGTDDGAHIYVDNHGIRSGAPEDLQALADGRTVDPEHIYFRCTPRLQGNTPAWAWLDRTVFIGTAERQPDHVLVNVFRLA